MKNKIFAISAVLLLTAALAFSYNRYSSSPETCTASQPGCCQKAEGSSAVTCDPESCPEGQDCCPFPCTE